MEDYETEGEEINSGSNNVYYSLKILKLKHDNHRTLKCSYLVVKVWRNEILCDPTKLLKTKELSIIIPTRHAFFVDPEYEQDALWMVYEDLQSYPLSSLTNEQSLLSAIQLGFSLSHLEEQGINLKISKQMLVVYEGRLYISLMQYDHGKYDKKSCFEAYLRIVIELLPNMGQHLYSKKSYKELIDYLVNIIQPPKQINQQWEVPYLWLLEMMIKPEKHMQKTDYEGNSYIYELTVPESLKYKQRNPHKSEIVIKSTKLPNPKDQDYEQQRLEIAQNIRRELEIFETFGPDEHVLQCWGYIKIYDQTFIFMDKNYDLINYLEWIRKQGCFGYILLTKLGLEFAKSLHTLHKHGFLHRDLKEGNLFVSQMAKDFGRLTVGDFDRSKHQQVDQTLKLTKEMTQGYNPPEVLQQQDHTQKSDLWQFGLIMYKIACPQFYLNEWNYLFYLEDKKQGKVSTNPLSNVEAYIRQELYKENLDQSQTIKREQVLTRVISLIKKCLDEDCNHRPSAQEIHDELKDLYFSVIKGIKPRLSTTYSLTSTSETDSPQRVESNPRTPGVIQVIHSTSLNNDLSPLQQVISPSSKTIRLISSKPAV